MSYYIITNLMKILGEKHVTLRVLFNSMKASEFWES